MAQDCAAQIKTTQNDSGTETRGGFNAFKRIDPLTCAPERLAIVLPLKQNCCETVSSDGSFSETSSLSRSEGAFEEVFEVQRRRRVRWRSLTQIEPFSFDERDAARKIEFERKLNEMRQMQEWCPKFKANPVRRYTPLIPPRT